MVGTRHAVSDNKSKSGLGMPSPYNPPNPNLNLLTLNNILITVLTAIATTFGVTSCM